MSTDLGYTDDVTGFRSTVQGSDRRLNVSSRSDGRGYYISRDKGDLYSLVFNQAAAAAGNQVVYLKNTDSAKQLVVQSVELNSEFAARVRLAFVSGTAAGGSAVVPTNLNHQKPHIAKATATVGVNTGLTNIGDIAFTGVPVGAPSEIRLLDRLRLGNGDAVALEYVEGTTGDLWGNIFFYYETVK